MNPRKAIVAGATGLVGTHLTDQLLAEPIYEKVILLTRKPLAISHPKIEQVIVNFDYADPVSLPLEADDIYCALGTTIRKAGSQAAFRKVDHDYVLNLAKYAVSIKAKRFLVVSAMGANPSSRIFYNRVKGEMEKSVSAAGVPEVHIFRPSLILGKRKEFRFGENIAQKVAGGLRFLFVGPLKNYRPIRAQTIAGAMTKAAQTDKPGVSIYPSGLMQNM
ncbi:MAG TPA: oxidoreductase [Bacteroidales bacterium]|nr:oxidoreductase [Bacteroidales bacterium]